MVNGWETVEVPAGKFRASGSNWTRDPSQRTARAPQRNGAYWYVPEVKRWVKLQTVCPVARLSEELLEYKLNEN